MPLFREKQLKLKHLELDRPFDLVLKVRDFQFPYEKGVKDEALAPEKKLANQV
jgi:hypothetical protein